MSKVASQTQSQTKANTLQPSGILRRKCDCGNHTLAGGDCEACSKKRLNLQRRAVDGQSEPSEVPPIVHDVLRSPGQPLDQDTRAFMEPRFGHDFGHVRVHTDARAAESARVVNALAYTVGRDITFGPAQYSPGTHTGRHLLAHELAHVVQQGSTSPAVSSLQYARDRSREDNAEVVADAVIAGRKPAVMRETAPRLQRQRALTEEDEPPVEASESTLANALVGAASLTVVGIGEELASLLPSLTPCTPASGRLQAEALHLFITQSYIPYSLGMFGLETTGLWASYLDRGSSALPRPRQSFKGKSTVVEGFTKHHKSAESEKEIVDAAGAALSGFASSLVPAPGATSAVPVASVIPAATLHTRINDKADPMGLDYDSPATTIPGNIAGGMGLGGPPGNTASDPDTRDVDGTLQLDVDASGSALTITPALNFKVHDTVDFCPGALGGTLARIETVPMSVLEATEGRFGPIFAADVPFDIVYPGPGVAKTISLSVSPPLPTPTPTPVPPPSVDCKPLSGDVIGERILFRINTARFLTAAEEIRLNTFAESLRSSNDKVKIHGFASIDGLVDFNDNLSCTRALRTAQLLRDKGVSPTQITDIFKHGAMPGPAQERRSVVLERVPGGPGPGPGPGPTPIPATVTLKKVQFTSDHHVMKDNSVDWENTGSPFPKPDWQSTNPGGKSAPISHDRNANVNVELVYDAVTDAPSGVPFTLIGQSNVGFLTFNASGTLHTGNGQVLSLASAAATKNEILAYPNQVITWSIQLPAGRQPLGTLLGLEVFVTMAPPRHLNEVTYKRMAKAVDLTGSIHTLDPHELVHGIMLNFGAYNLDVQYDNAWKMADNIKLGAQCIDIVRFVMGLIETVGCPGVAEAKLIWARPTDPARAVESDYLGGDSLHNYPPHPAHPTWGAALIDANACPNNFEAALKFTFGDTRYYPGGVPLIDQFGRKVIFTSAQQVLEIFQYLAWIEGVRKKTWIAREFLISYTGRRTDRVPFTLVCDSKVLP